jgi:hypothetical protein
LFSSLGYQCCDSRHYEQGIEKVAIYARGNEVQHAARQLMGGHWSSKLGRGPLIEHDFDALSGHNAQEYGDIIQLMKRIAAR